MPEFRSEPAFDIVIAGANYHLDEQESSLWGEYFREDAFARLMFVDWQKAANQYWEVDYTHGKDSCWIVTLQSWQKSDWEMARDPEHPTLRRGISKRCATRSMPFSGARRSRAFSP